MEELYRGRMADCGVSPELARGANLRYVEAAADVRWRRGAPALLSTLRALHIKTVLLTNGGARFQRQKISNLGLAAMVDAVAISDEIGHAKPSPAAFLAALAAVDQRPSDAVMIGDDYTEAHRSRLAATDVARATISRGQRRSLLWRPGRGAAASGRPLAAT